jgi:hypothetical protein
LILNLKKKYSELKKEHSKLIEEYDQLKKRTKTTKIMELSVENKELHEELIKLKNFYEISVQQNILNEKQIAEFSSLQETYNKQQFVVITYQENIKKLETELSERSKEIKRLNSLLNDNKIKNIKIKKDSKSSKNEIVHDYDMNTLGDNKNMITLQKENEYYKEMCKKLEARLKDNDSRNLNTDINNDNILLLRSKLLEEKSQRELLENRNKDIRNKLKSYESISETDYKGYELLNDDQLNELVYILIKNLEANKIDSHIIENRLFNNLKNKDIMKPEFFEEFKSALVALLYM